MARDLGKAIEEALRAALRRQVRARPGVVRATSGASGDPLVVTLENGKRMPSLESVAVGDRVWWTPGPHPLCLGKTYEVP